MCILKNNGNGNKCLTAMEMGMKVMRMGRNGKDKRYSRTSLLNTSSASYHYGCDKASTVNLIKLSQAVKLYF